MTDEEIEKIGDEMVKVLGPVYQQLDRLENKVDRLENKVDGIENKVDRLENKQDALFVDIKQLQDEVGVARDEAKNREEKNQKEHDEIRQYVNMPQGNL